MSFDNATTTELHWSQFWAVVQDDFPNLRQLEVQVWHVRGYLEREFMASERMLKPLRGERRGNWVLRWPWDIDVGGEGGCFGRI